MKDWPAIHEVRAVQSRRLLRHLHVVVVAEAADEGRDRRLRGDSRLDPSSRRELTRCSNLIRADAAGFACLLNLAVAIVADFFGRAR